MGWKGHLGDVVAGEWIVTGALQLVQHGHLLRSHVHGWVTKAALLTGEEGHEGIIALNLDPQTLTGCPHCVVHPTLVRRQGVQCTRP